MLDREQLRLQISQEQADRNYRAGGRAPARWAVRLVAVACGIAPSGPLTSFERPHLRLIFDLGVPLSVALLYLCTKFWQSFSWPPSPAQQRQATKVTVVTAAAMCIAVYSTIGVIDQTELSWVLWHFTEPVTWAIVIIFLIMRAGSWTPPREPGKYRSPALNTRDHEDRARRPDATAERYTAQPSFLRKSQQLVAPRAQ